MIKSTILILVPEGDYTRFRAMLLEATPRGEALVDKLRSMETLFRNAPPSGTNPWDGDDYQGLRALLHHHAYAPTVVEQAFPSLHKAGDAHTIYAIRAGPSDREVRLMTAARQTFFPDMAADDSFGRLYSLAARDQEMLALVSRKSVVYMLEDRVASYRLY